MHVLIVTGREEFSAALYRGVFEQFPQCTITLISSTEAAERIASTAAGSNLVAIVDVHTPVYPLGTEEANERVTAGKLITLLTEADAWIITVHEHQGDLAQLGRFRGSEQIDHRDARRIVEMLEQSRPYWDELYIPRFENAGAAPSN